MDGMLGCGNSASSGCIEYFDLRVHLRFSAFVLVHKGIIHESGPYHVRVGCEAGRIPGGTG